MDVAVPADHKVKIKENKNYLDLARELEKLWSMKVTVIPIVIGVLGTIPKGLVRGMEELEIGGRAEAIATIALVIKYIKSLLIHPLNTSHFTHLTTKAHKTQTHRRRPCRRKLQLPDVDPTTASVTLRKSWLLCIGSAHSLFKIPRKFSVIKKKGLFFNKSFFHK